MVYLPEFEENLARQLFQDEQRNDGVRWSSVHPSIHDRYIARANLMIVRFMNSGWTPPGRKDLDE